jgi:hypothetical protein
MRHFERQDCEGCVAAALIYILSAFIRNEDGYGHVVVGTSISAGRL